MAHKNTDHKNGREQNSEKSLVADTQTAPHLNVFKKHVFVCTEGKKCPHRGSEDVLSELRKLLKKSELCDEPIRINKSGCLSQCDYGPVVVVYPEGVWYCQVTVDDCKNIVDDHLINNKLVDKLFLP